MIVVIRRLCATQIARVQILNSTSCITAQSSLQGRRCYAATEIKPATRRTDPCTESKLSEWRTIYRLPLIRLVSAFNRLKIYQAAITAFGTPLVFALGQAGEISSQATFICASVGISGLLTLTLSSYLTKNLIGYIYVNDANDLLKLAYVDFWGRRLETLIAIEDLLPDWDEDGNKRSAFYQSIWTRSDEQCRYKLLHRFGIVSDPLIYTSLFGE